MKIIGIALLMMGCLMAFSLGINIFQALYNTVNPFRVIEVTELFVLFFLLFLFFAESVYLFIKKRNQSQ